MNLRRLFESLQIVTLVLAASCAQGRVDEATLRAQELAATYQSDDSCVSMSTTVVNPSDPDAPFGTMSLAIHVVIVDPVASRLAIVTRDGPTQASGYEIFVERGTLTATHASVPDGSLTLATDGLASMATIVELLDAMQASSLSLIPPLAIEPALTLDGSIETIVSGATVSIPDQDDAQVLILNSAIQDRAMVSFLPENPPVREPTPKKLIRWANDDATLTVIADVETGRVVGATLNTDSSFIGFAGARLHVTSVIHHVRDNDVGWDDFVVASRPQSFTSVEMFAAAIRKAEVARVRNDLDSYTVEVERGSETIRRLDAEIEDASQKLDEARRAQDAGGGDLADQISQMEVSIGLLSQYQRMASEHRDKLSEFVMAAKGQLQAEP